MNWLVNTCHPQKQQHDLSSLYNLRQLWTENEKPYIPHIPYSDMLSGDSGVTNAMKSILKYGVVMITQVKTVQLVLV